MRHIELIKHFGKRTKKEQGYLGKANLNIPVLYNKSKRRLNIKNYKFFNKSIILLIKISLSSDKSLNFSEISIWFLIVS